MISHAATPAMRAGRFPARDARDSRDSDGAPDALASRDVEAARAFGEQRLTPHRAWRVVASPARCARETAIAMGFEPHDEPALADLDYGSWHGRTLKDVADEDADAFAAWASSPSQAPHGGESFRDLVERVAEWLDSAAGETLIAVTHAIVVRAALVRVLEMPLGAFRRLEVAPLSLVDLRRSSNGWALWTA
jgi:broad specificity phosphatase PhoE